MAKNFNSSLPKVISRANKDISTIIENDIAKESVLLKELVDQVLKSNIEVKKKNNQRILDTKRKLKELDNQIDDLTVSIDLVDRETVIQQLNEMIDAKNKIFNARQEIRFFDNENLPSRIDNYNTIHHTLTSSIKGVGGFENDYRNKILQANKTILDTQKETTDKITTILLDIAEQKRSNITKSLLELDSIRTRITDFETVYNEQLKSSINYEYELTEESKSNFYNVDSDEILNKQINQTHKDNFVDLKQKIVTLKETYKAKQNEIKQSYKDYETSVLDKFEQKNKATLDKEKSQKIKIETELKEIRLDIMQAEKQRNFSEVAKLLKKFEKTEKLLDTKSSKKLSKETDTLTKTKKDKTIQSLRDLELKYVKDNHNIEYEQQFEQIRYQEAKILHKIQTDYDGLNGDLEINRKKVQSMKELLLLKSKLQREIHQIRLELRLTELEILQHNDYIELDIHDKYKELLLTLKETEVKRTNVLQQNIDTHSIIRLEQEYKLKKAIEDIKLDQESHDIDKLILTKRNETVIEQQQVIESLNSDIIYQESLIAIAKKEHELQLIKVKSLYENERSLAEEQKERINLGIKVNDTFVKTTLQNQLLFAEQQIKCADSEFDIRVESINLTFEQEVQYANKKIEYYRQKYEYEKQKFVKELEDKLEDLNYKLLLFTESKDNKEIQDKIDELQAHYDGLIQEIEDVENKDEEILRYEKVINDAEARQLSAIEEAQLLREQTVTSFQSLYDATKIKFDQVEESEASEVTKGIMPLLNSATAKNSDQRLQQAIKEADQLYHERIGKPEATIKETKERVIELSNSDETEKFITEQRTIKHEKLKHHKETTDQLETLRKENITPLYSELTVTEESNIDSEAIKTSLFSGIRSLSKKDIDDSYVSSIQFENKRTQSIIQKDQTYIKTKLKDVDNDHKKSIQLIKQALNPYRKYIKFASKGVNASKKELKKDYNKKLKRLLSDTQKVLKDKEYLK